MSNERDEAVEAKEAGPELPQFLENPDGTDIFLLVMLFVIAIYSIAMIPLRAWVLGHPLAYTLLVGGYTSSVIGGANAAAGSGFWWVYLPCTLFGMLKFMPFYYWMGRRWGMEFIDMSLQSSPRLQRVINRALSARRARTVTASLIPVGYLPGPVPNTIVNGVLGLLRVAPGLVAALNVAFLALINGTFMALGWTFGEPVLDVVEVVNRYVLWVTLALLAVAFVQAFRQARGRGVAR